MFSTIAKISGVNQDITKYTKKYGQKSISLDFAIGDAIYMGARLPFNHAFIKKNNTLLIGTGFKVSLYGGPGKGFVEVGRVSDETYGLVENGIIEFSPKENKGWHRQNSTEINDISDVQYLDQYWLKIKFEDAVTLDLDFIGHCFSNDYDLFSEHPALKKDKFFTFFSQTDFEKQAILASELIESSLIANGYAKGNEQILQWEDLTLASVAKVAQILYTAFGSNYTDDVERLKREYTTRINSSFPLIDSNGTAEKAGNKKMIIKSLHR